MSPKRQLATSSPTQHETLPARLSEDIERRSKMPRTALLDSELLDPDKMGRQAEDLENQLRHFVVGQEEAIHEIVRATAQSLLKNSRAVIKIDCAEFQHSHEIAKLTGSPPGYLGHRETHSVLSQEALDQNPTDTTKLSFVLFDEIEKASDALWNLLLGIL